MKTAKDIAAQIKSKISKQIDIGLILGSGWGEVVHMLENKITIPYASLTGMPTCSVQGHAGNFVIGELHGKTLCLLQGRFHLYEGITAKDVTLPIDIFYHLGIGTFFVTNASGGLNKDFNTGQLMIINDHINLTATNPLIAGNLVDGRPLFVDMTTVYDPEYISILSSICTKHDFAFSTGCYLQVTGPSYETKAEVQAYARLGADAVGMSTTLEVIKARYYGMKCAGVSLISNMGTGIVATNLSHESVLATTISKKENLKTIISEFVRQAKI